MYLMLSRVINHLSLIFFFFLESERFQGTRRSRRHGEMPCLLGRRLHRRGGDAGAGRRDDRSAQVGCWSSYHQPLRGEISSG